MTRPIASIIDEIDRAVDTLKRSPLSLSSQASAEHALQAVVRQNWSTIREAVTRPNPFADVQDFHEKYQLEYDGPPRELDVDLGDFRLKFMVEELAEYAGLSDADREMVQAIFTKRSGEQPPLVDKLDALVDLEYVVLGTAYLHGFPHDEAWRRVQEANMAKKKAEPDGSDSRRGSPHDVVKPPGWTAPDLTDLVQVQ